MARLPSTHTSSKQAILVEEDLLWRFAESYILESANFKVTPIRRKALQHCITKSACAIDLAIIRITNDIDDNTLMSINTLKRKQGFKLILLFKTCKLALLKQAFQLNPDAMILSSDVRNLLDTLNAFDRKQRYYSHQISELLYHYDHLIDQIPGALKSHAQQNLMFDGKQILCNPRCNTGTRHQLEQAIEKIPQAWTLTQGTTTLH